MKKNKKEWVIAVFLFLIIPILFLVSFFYPEPRSEWVYYRIAKGDSIFSIAQEVCDPLDHRDPRAIVEEIKQKNKKKESKEIDEIERGIIYADQVIEIPLYTTPEAKRAELREFSRTIKPGQI